MKEKSLKSLLAAALAALMLCTAAFPVQGATEYASLLVLGDSVSTGYGLPGYDSSDSYKCNSYANLLAAALGLNEKRSYNNLAVNGATSKDLLSSLQSNEKTIEKADLIVISIGGNDLLQAVPEATKEITGLEFDSLPQAVNVLKAAGEELLEQIFGGDIMQGIVEKSISAYKRNLKSIISYIRKHNEQATLVFLAQYDPLAQVDNYVGIGKYESAFIDSLNAALSDAVSGKAEVADVPSVMPDAKESTNIMTFDIHPNETGHKVIFELLSSMLGVDAAEAQTAAVTEFWTEAATEALSETEPAPLTGDTEKEAQNEAESGIITIGAETGAAAEAAPTVWGTVWKIAAAGAALVVIAAVVVLIVVKAKKKK